QRVDDANPERGFTGSDQSRHGHDEIPGARGSETPGREHGARCQDRSVAAYARQAGVIQRQLRSTDGDAYAAQVRTDPEGGALLGAAPCDPVTEEADRSTGKGGRRAGTLQ